MRNMLEERSFVDQDTESHLEVRTLCKQDEPLTQQIKQWIGQNSKTARLYTFAMSHPTTLTYMVVFGGILQQWQGILMISLLLPPIFVLGFIHLRIKFLNPSSLSQLDTKDLFRYYNNDKGRLYVAVDNNNIVATMACDRKDCHTAVVKHMLIHAKYRCKDIAQTLLDNTLDFCKEEHYQKVWLQFTNLQVQTFGSGFCRNNGFKWFKDETLLTILPGVTLTWQHFVLDASRL